MTIELLDADIVQRCYLITRALNHPLRRQIIEHLAEAGDAGLTVGEIYQDARYNDKKGNQMEQSVASQHLAILRSQNLVSTEREGKYIRYRIEAELLKHLQWRISSMVEAVESCEVV